MKIGIIGGSGLDDPKFFEEIKSEIVMTPYGAPSSEIKIGKINEIEICILARHSNKHTITPTQVNNRANIFALQKLGCTHIIVTTAVGSLREEIKPGDLIILDQFIDFTKHRKSTFFENFEKGIEHTSLADPFSEELRKKLIESCEELNFSFHKKGTVITIEGPRFSTRAESKMFRIWGADVINMSIAPETTLAKEIGIEYAAVAMSTDYDSWKDDENAVTAEMVFETMRKNAQKVTQLLIKTIQNLSEKKELEKKLKEIKNKIRTIPNFPKPGIMFRDITTLFKDPQALKNSIDIFYQRYKDKKIDIVAGIESRGFIIGGILARELNTGFVPIRKKGKLPHEVITEEYFLEYGVDQIEIHKDAITSGQRVLLIDDLIATGGTAQAATRLIEKLEGEIVECAFIIDLPELKGKQKLLKYPVYSLIEFQGE